MIILNKVKEKFNELVVRAKKSFTLVELSVVLVVLSLLIGTLLVGRQIVDRAKVQRVMSEIDHYNKNFTLFRDTYGTIPGTIDPENCASYDVFSSSGACNINNDENDETNYYKVAHPNAADSISNGDNDVDQNLNVPFLTGYFGDDSYIVFGGGTHSMAQMKASGLINNVSGSLGSYTKGEVDDLEYTASFSESAAATKAFNGFASFDEKTMMTYTSISNYNLDYRGISGAFKLYDENNTNLLNVKGFQKLKDRNAILLFKFIEYNANDDNLGIRYNSKGVLSSNLTNDLDLKMDDGRPGSGSILAIRSGKGNMTNDASIDPTKICHNGPKQDTAPFNVYADNGGYYIDDSREVNGCNILYIMNE